VLTDIKRPIPARLICQTNERMPERHITRLSTRGSEVANPPAVGMGVGVGVGVGGTGNNRSVSRREDEVEKLSNGNI
jgi:hypothetical protein